MERSTTPPPSAPRIQKLFVSPEANDVLSRWRKKRVTSTPDVQQPAAPETQTKPDTAPKQSFGANILSFLVSRPKVDQAPAPTAPDATSPDAAPEVQPVIHNAQRVRRFARVVLGHVFGQAKAEADTVNPVDTQPLFDAAADLKDATQTLDATLRDAKQDRVFLVPRNDATPDSSGGGEFISPEAPARPFVDYRASERIADHVAKLEKQAESARSINMLAIGLGVIAVIIAGHEHRARKRSERRFTKERTEMTATIYGQQRELQTQKQAFEELRQENVGNMDRAHRKEYYDRLGEFTHQQADTTRQVDRAVHEVLAVQPVEQAVRPEWQPRQPLAERVQVEKADNTERSPSLAHDAASFAGGVGTSGAGGLPDVRPDQREQQPLTPAAALRAEAERKVRAARLASNAWLYGTVLALTITAFVVAIVLLG